MHTLSLKDSDERLYPLAPFYVLAVMCHPTDREMCEHMLAQIQRETGAQKPRRGGLSNDTFLREVILRSNRGMLAGRLLLALLQLHENRIRHGLNRAIPLVTSLLEKWVFLAAWHWTARR